MDEILSALQIKSSVSMGKRVVKSSRAKAATPTMSPDVGGTHLTEEIATHVPMYQHRYNKKLEMPMYNGDNNPISWVF